MEKKEEEWKRNEVDRKWGGGGRVGREDRGETVVCIKIKGRIIFKLKKEVEVK